MHTVSASPAGDCQWREECAFEKYVFGAVRHCSGQAAHYACHGDGFVRIGDHQRFCIQGNFLAIEQGNLLTFFSHANIYVPT